MTDLSTTDRAPGWIRWWFRGAALYGTIAIAASLTMPPPGDPFFFRAFAGTAFAFQVAFWIVGGDPVRHRPLMLAGVVEKLGFVGPALMAHATGSLALAAVVDGMLGLGFLFAWWRTPRDA